ncbi:MAG: hypothetical protein J5892_00560 [Bacilli bacterium]|nr:hypothetical protein [Bacilli bacterium]
MPCISIHLAVAKKYLENHPEEDKKAFMLGTLGVDINEIDISNYIKIDSDDKNARHFGLNQNTDNIIDYMKRKVDLGLFLSKNDINNSFLRAYFLHLLCDYYFFGDYIFDESIAQLPLMEAIKIGYNDYSLITPILIEKYQLIVPPEAKKFTDLQGVGDIRFLKVDLVDKFISDMANLDLESEKTKYQHTCTIK